MNTLAPLQHSLNNPSSLLDASELDRWSSLRTQIIEELENDFSEASELVRQYFKQNSKPSFSECIPLFLRQSRSSDVDTRYDTAWILLYVTASVMDDLHDGDIDITSKNIEAIQYLAIFATSRISQAYTAYHVDVENVFKKTFLGQTANLNKYSTEIEVFEAASAKNALLEIPVSRESQNVLRNKEATEGLQFAIQALDDISDIVTDASRGLRTTICEPCFSSMTKHQILTHIAHTNKLSALLTRIRSVIDNLLEDLERQDSKLTSLRCFLVDISAACKDLDNTLYNLLEAESASELRRQVEVLEEKILIYAIGS